MARFQVYKNWDPDASWLATRSINAEAKQRMNSVMMAKFPGEENKHARAVDTVDNERQYHMDSTTGSHHQSGFPRHPIKLKAGCPIMLLRNLDPPLVRLPQTSHQAQGWMPHHAAKESGPTISQAFPDTPSSSRLDAPSCC